MNTITCCICVLNFNVTPYLYSSKLIYNALQLRLISILNITITAQYVIFTIKLDAIASASSARLDCLDNAPDLGGWKLFSEVVYRCILNSSAGVVIVLVRYLQGYGH